MAVRFFPRSREAHFALRDQIGAKRRAHRTRPSSDPAGAPIKVMTFNLLQEQLASAMIPWQMDLENVLSSAQWQAGGRELDAPFRAAAAENFRHYNVKNTNGSTKMKRMMRALWNKDVPDAAALHAAVEELLREDGSLFESEARRKFFFRCSIVSQSC